MKAPQPFLADKTLPLLVGAGGEVAGNPEALADWARAQRALHGRKPFTGKRRTLVAMA